MGSKLVMAVIILAIVGLGYYVYSSYGGSITSQVKPLIQTYVPSSITQKFSTGDIMTLNLQPLTNVHTVTSATPDANTLVTTNNISNTTKSNYTKITSNATRLVATAGKTYGYTNNNKEILPTGTFQLGTPIQITGNLQMVLPNTCTNNNGQVTCQYVQPPIWKFLIIISCKIDQNVNCAMDDYPHWGTTDGNGNYNMTWITNSGSMNGGPYLVSIQASSLVKDSHGLQYTISQQELVNLVQ